MANTSIRCDRCRTGTSSDYGVIVVTRNVRYEYYVCYACAERLADAVRACIDEPWAARERDEAPVRP